ncbi:MAG: glycerophosphodiester phosphodiesterase family protein [Gammaproteobacteria bacterium]|nr:glycerophosphodiester phosphodiesterase family protein [Gammaproteobacteria bacterium]
MASHAPNLDQIAFNCIGHRGACGYAPENTLSSFELAIAMGCPWIELDVYHIDGELLVIHDDTLDRTTNGRGYVMDQSVAYLRSLDAGDGQQIPTLTEVIELIDHRAGINVELKGPDTGEAVVSLIHSYQTMGWHADEFLLSSFQHQELERVRTLDQELKLGALFGRATDNLVEKAQQLDAYAINLGKRLAQKQLIDKAHEAGLRVFVYTVNVAEDIAQMLRLNVDGVFTNYPDRIFTLIGEV